MALRSFYGVSVCSVSCLLSIEQSCAWMWARYYPVAGTTPLARFKPPSMTRMATVVASITGSPVVGRVAFIMGSRNVELHLLWRYCLHSIYGRITSMAMSRIWCRSESVAASICTIFHSGPWSWCCRKCCAGITATGGAIQCCGKPMMSATLPITGLPVIDATTAAKRVIDGRSA